jgi:GDP-4-dehydro-6-deoxy-D-mannose reductase
MTADNSAGLQRVLITGGTGFVGPHLIRHLKQHASAIAVIASDKGFEADPDVEYYSVDIRDQNAVASVLQRVRPTRVYHLAGISAVDVSWSNPRLTYEVNVSGTFNVFAEAMALSPSPRILNISTSQVYASSPKMLTENSPVQPSNPYAATKAMGELLAVQYRRASSGGIVSARAFNHSGPGQTPKFFLSSLARQFAEVEFDLRPAKLVVGNLHVKRDFSDVRDVVRAYRLLSEKGHVGEVYNVCSGTSIGLDDVVEIFRSKSNVKVAIETEPERQRSAEAPEICGDPSKIREHTGWTPEIPLVQTIADLLDYWRLKCRDKVAQIEPER